MDHEEAKAIHAAYRPGELEKFKNVQNALQLALEDCPPGKSPTQDAVRLKLPGQSSGTVIKYLPVVQALAISQGGQQVMDEPPSDPAVLAGKLKFNAAVAAAFATFAGTAEAQIRQLITTDNLRLASTVVAHSAMLQEEISRREQAEENATRFAAEAAQRSAEIDILKAESAEIRTSVTLLEENLANANREIALEIVKGRGALEHVVILDATVADLRRDLDASRIDRASDKERADKAEADREASESLRMEDAANNRQQTDALRIDHGAEIAKIRAIFDADVIEIRAACAREVGIERDRNAELGLALVRALTTQGAEADGTKIDAG